MSQVWGVVDPAAAARLAAVDPALPHLADALAPAFDGAAWTLHDARWVPGVRCRLAYRVASSPLKPATFVAVDVTPDGITRYDFRDDSAIPGLALAADVLAVRERLRHLGAVRGCVIEPVRYRPGSRCVLRYQLATDDGPTRLYAKALGVPAGTAALTVSAALAQSASPPLRMLPSLVATWPEYGVLVHTAVEGPSLSSVLGDSGVPVNVRLRLAGRLGDLLARFHAQDLAAPARTPADALRTVDDSLAAATHADQNVGHRLASVLDRLSSWTPTADAGVLGHGGFRAGQVIVARGGLTLVDLDGVCRCHAERDLATALAHLTWQGISCPRERTTLEAAGRAFVAGYERHAGRVDPTTLSWWRVVALVHVAARRYRRLEFADWEHVPVLVDYLEHDLATALRNQPTARLPQDMLDSRGMTRTLRPLLAPVARIPDAVKVTAARMLQHRHDRRIVVWYAVRGLRRTAPVQVVGKLFTEPRRAVISEANLRALAEGPFKDGVLRVPEPLPALPERGLVLYRWSVGVPLDGLGGTEVVAGCRAAARWLARLHRSDVRFTRQFDLASESASCRAWATVIGDGEPDLRAAALILAERWAAAALAHDLRTDVPIHKDFHAGHVLVDNAVTVIDLDEARMGDPAFDLAHFCAYLDLRAGARSALLRRAFLDEYATTAYGHSTRASLPTPERLALFRAYAWLKIAKQLVKGTGPHRLSDGQRRTSTVADALVKGLQCLDK